VFFEISLDTRDKFKSTTRNTQKAGMLFKILLTSLNFYSYWEMTRYFEHVTCLGPIFCRYVKHIACVRYWTTLVIVISFRIKYKQSLITWCLYVKVWRWFAELFVYTVLDFIRLYVCNRVCAVEVNSELDVSPCVCEKKVD
jgi:hypothetical protein